MLNFNQINIWQYTDNQIKLINDDKQMIIYHDGKWTLREYESNKETHWMNIVYENENILDFCYWLNDKEFKIA